jgi:uncharacterized protein (DUF58 family)
MSLRQGAYGLLVLGALLGTVGEWVPGFAGLWRLPAALLLLGLAWERFETARLRPTLAVDAPVRWLLARPQPFTLRLHVPGARARVVELAPALPAGVEAAREVLTLRTAGPAGAQATLDAVARRLGSSDWPAQRARVAGTLGLAWWNVALRPGHAFEVVPDTLQFRERAAGLTGSGARLAVPSGAGGQVDQLRDHRPGDPLRIVDWKATARRGALTSREFVDDGRLDIVLALDVGRSSGIWCGDLDRLGHYVNVAARFAEHAVAHEDRVGLVVYADRPLQELPPARGPAAIARIRACLARLHPRKTESNPLPMAARVRALARQRSLVVLLTDIDDAASTSQLAGALRLLQPKHLPLVVGLASAELEGYSRRAAREWLDPWLALAAQIRAEQQERALRALGAPVILARPERLEREVFATYAGFRARRRV